MRTITLTEALNELKLLDKKINKKLRNLSSGNDRVLDVVKGNKDECVYSRMKVQDFKNEARSNLDSILALMKNRQELKSKLAEANAKCTVKIGSKEYSIAGAIERKKSIQFDKDLIIILQDILEQTEHQVNSSNDRVEKDVDKLLEARLGSDAKNVNSDEINSIRETLLNPKLMKLIDPLDLKKIVSDLNTEVEEFETEVNTKLTIVNSTNTIDVDF